jgi:hypothetical protein
VKWYNSPCPLPQNKQIKRQPINQLVQGLDPRLEKLLLAALTYVYHSHVYHQRHGPSIPNEKQQFIIYSSFCNARSSCLSRYAIYPMYTVFSSFITRVTHRTFGISASCSHPSIHRIQRSYSAGYPDQRRNPRNQNEVCIRIRRFQKNQSLLKNPYFMSDS